VNSRGCAHVFAVLAMALFGLACESTSVPEWPYVLAAQDAGASDAGDAADGRASVRGQNAAPTDPLACDGALCNTTNYSYTGCDVAGKPVDEAPFAALGIVVAMVVAWRRRPTRTARGTRQRRSRHEVIVGAALLTLVTGARAVADVPAAESSPPAPSSEAAWPLTATGAVDVMLREPPPARRVLAIEWNPLAAATLHRWSANVIFAPFEHHALILSPLHAYARTYPINLYDDEGDPLLLPVQRFYGWGGELGYRYYTGRGGLRGLFLGPSLFSDWMTVYAQNGAATSYIYYGLAADVGYQVLLCDRVSLSVGGGVQYGRPDKDIPKQGFFAKYYANSMFAPRWLVSIGWAL
jgi:hypothetical protein